MKILFSSSVGGKNGIPYGTAFHTYQFKFLIEFTPMRPVVNYGLAGELVFPLGTHVTPKCSNL